MAKILLAEDEKQIADMISFKLGNGGHHIIRAEDGEQAVASAGSELPDRRAVLVQPGMFRHADGRFCCCHPKVGALADRHLRDRMGPG